jgi:cystathionine beta-lyase/cystathionine gamma-synthase
MKLTSLCVHGARDSRNDTGSIAVPIYQTATYAHPSVGESTGYDYSRVGNPTRDALERLMSQLEDGSDTLAFSTGMAAIAALMELFRPGDRLIASDTLYGGSIRLFDHISAKNGITVDYVDSTNAANVAAALTPQTKAVFLETPTNPLMRVTDIAAVRAAIGRDVLLVVDNTFLTPIFQQPLALGADVVVHSGTKYLGGHNDALGGFVVTRDSGLAEKLAFIRKTTGAVLSPFDSFLMIRGIKTLALRMAQSAGSAMRIATWLAAHPKVKTVYFPGLPDHPDYAVSQKQGRGFGAMISFETHDDATATQVLARLRMIRYAESLGGVESLITFPALQTHADMPAEQRERLGIHHRLLRLSVGVEDVEDLIEDLAESLG